MIENRCQFLISNFFSSCIMDKLVSQLFLPFSPVNKYEKINTQLLFSTINIKKIIEPWIFQLFAAKPFPRSFVNYNDLNLQENLKLNVAITFQCLFFGIRIDQSIAFQVTKVTKGEDPSAEVPRDYSGKEGGRGLLLVHATYIPSFAGLILAQMGMWRCTADCGFPSSRLLTISLFSAFDMVGKKGPCSCPHEGKFG